MRLLTNGKVEPVAVMRGKALLNENETEFTFVEERPRGPRSKEVHRTMHGRCVRRPDGMYTITFRVDGSERWLREFLVTEVGEVVAAILTDRRGRGEV